MEMKSIHYSLYILANTITHEYASRCVAGNILDMEMRHGIILELRKDIYK